MNKEEFKLSDKELQKAIDELQGTNFLNAFCILDWILKTRKENQELKDRIKTYEDPEDLTLMFMYCDEQSKDKIKELQQRIEKAIEYIETHKRKDEFLELNEWGTRELLEILKGE